MDNKYEECTVRLTELGIVALVAFAFILIDFISR